LPWLPELYLTARPALTARALERTGLPADYARHYAQRLAMPGAARAALGWYRAIPFSLRESFSLVEVPTTFIWGRGDPYLGRAAAEATASYVAGDYRFIELDAGHWLPETRSTEVVAAILERIGVTT
jgi:pimeloyl-ACP methyl ester carboxylesterase